MPREDPERLYRYLAEHQPDCPRCRYSLVGLRSDRCPECGSKLSVGAFLAAERRRTGMPRWVQGVGQATAVVCFFTILMWLFGARALLLGGASLLIAALGLSVAMVLGFSAAVLITWKRGE